MSQMAEMQYASARATTEFVGQTKVLNEIHQAITSPKKGTKIFYFAATGGTGKTRLLEEIVKRLQDQGEEGWYDPQILAPENLIDFYHLHTHSEEGLIQELFSVLGQDGTLFKKYQEERNKFIKLQQDLKGAIRIIHEQRSKMKTAFIEDLNLLSKKSQKCVILFDTTETLVYETDKLMRALGLKENPFGVTGWLVNDFLSQIENAVIVIAGRPNKAFERDLKSLGRKHNIEITTPELKNFSLDESLEYFDKIVITAENENPEVAARIKNIPADMKEVIHFITDGKPLLLALFIDYLAVSGELRSDALISLQDAKKLSGTRNKQKREDLQKLLIEGFKEARRHKDDIIDALSWAPKGMGKELLAWFLKRDIPSEEDIENAKTELDEIRAQRLSFIKVRKDDVVFLQDEMYAIYDQIHAVLGPNTKAKNLRIILKYYKYKIKEVENKIKQLQEENIAQMGKFTSEKREFSTAYFEKLEEIYDAQTRLHNYKVEQVFYNLLLKPTKGFEQYFEYAEETILNNAPDLWLPLRDELLKYANNFEGNYDLVISGLRLQDIESDIGIRWPAHYIELGDYDQALKLLDKFENKCADLLNNPFTELNFLIRKARALLYSGKNLSDAEIILKSVDEKLNSLSPEDSTFEAWQKNLWQAYLHNDLGYLLRTRGLYREAVPEYRAALPFWRELRFEAQHANTLNNLAFALMESGEFQDSLAHCHDALHLRYKLGARHNIALSLNTLGLIETRNDQPERACRHIEQALTIFTDLGQDRGIGLAAHALAEANRRMTNVEQLLSDEEVMDNLQSAEAYALQAVEIFTNKRPESFRLAEALIELGCVYRELTRHIQKDNPKRKEMYLNSEKALREAEKRAGSEFAYRAVDALVNLGWLYYYYGEKGKAEALLIAENERIVGKYIPNEYLFTAEHNPIPEKNIQDLVPWFWVQMGKADLLLGKIHFDRYRDHIEAGEIEKAHMELREATRIWTLSLAYNRRYGEDYRDFNKGKQELYRELVELNIDEMKILKSSMLATHKNYHIPKELQSFRLFLKNRFGIA